MEFSCHRLHRRHLELTDAFLACAAYEFSALPATLTVGEIKGETYKKADAAGNDTFVNVADDTPASNDSKSVIEYKP
jgi:hypothetical protein